jgi:hypothetical protein
MCKTKISSGPTSFVVNILPLEAIYIFESTLKDNVVLGYENISRAKLILLVDLLVPKVLCGDASVLGSYGVVFTSCLDF